MVNEPLIQGRVNLLKVIQKRLPSRREALLLFVACAFVVNLWSYINLLQALPSLLGQLRLAETLIVISYVLGFALFESVLVFIAMIIIGMILPGGVIRDDWVAYGALFVFIISMWAISFHYLPYIFLAWNNLVQFLNRFVILPISENIFIMVGLILFLFTWILFFAFLMIWMHYQIRRGGSIAIRIHVLLERLVVLTFIYLAVDILCSLVVFWRILVL
jgi:hypothetical protein